MHAVTSPISRGTCCHVRLTQDIGIKKREQCCPGNTETRITAGKTDYHRILLRQKSSLMLYSVRRTSVIPTKLHHIRCSQNSGPLLGINYNRFLDASVNTTTSLFLMVYVYSTRNCRCRILQCYLSQRV